MRMMRLALLIIVFAASLAATFQGMQGGYFWAGVSALGIAGDLYARHLQRTGKQTTGGLRIYSIVFSFALLAAAVVFAILAATHPPEERGAFIGLAVLWLFMAAGAGSLVYAMERRIRRGDPGGP